MLTRRTFLQLSAMTVVACGSEEGKESALLEDRVPVTTGPEFPVGLASGDATSTRVTLWTRYVGALALRLTVLERPPESTREIIVVEEVVAIGPDGFTHIEVENLEPGTRYRFFFTMHDANGIAVARSPLGHFKTAIADSSLEIVTFGGTACTHHDFAPFPALVQASRRTELDFFLHAGDKIYCDGAHTLEEYRAKYVTSWTADGQSLLHRTMGWYSTWDDHEVENDWSPETFDRAQLTAATRAYFEHNPIRRHPESPDRLWRSFRWGRTAEIFLLDCRSERKPSSRLGPAAQYISEVQMSWLKDGLVSSPAVFKFIVNSVPIAAYPAHPDFDLDMIDRWQGYAAQRESILSHILERDITGVFWLSGDIHAGGVGRIGPAGSPHAGMQEIMMGPGGQIGWAKVLEHFEPPQWSFVTPLVNVAIFRADPHRRKLEVTFLDIAGQPIFTTELEA